MQGIFRHIVVNRVVQSRITIGSACLTAVLFLVFGSMAVASANDLSSRPAPKPPQPWHWSEGLPLGMATQWMGQSDSTVYYDDLTVESGEIYAGDIIVYSGDVRLEADSKISGGLVVYSGDIVMEPGALVEGDVIALSGDAQIAGAIRGSLVIWSGDVTLEDGAAVQGDVSVMSGDIERSAAATVAGNIIVGPKLPKLPTFLEGIDLPNIASQSTIIEAAPPTLNASGWNQVGRFVLRIIGAAFMTALVVFITGVVYYLQPTFIQGLRTTIRTQKPTSFVIGLLLNIVLTMLIMAAFGSGSVFTALCLAPLSFVALLLFLILNTGGWAALSMIVGERLLAFAKVTTHQLTALVIGATAMTGTIALVWALGSCMRPVAYLIMLTLTALGGGSLIVQQLQKKRSDKLSPA